MADQRTDTIREIDASPMTVWVTSDAMSRGVRVVLTVPHENPQLARDGWRSLITTKPGEPYHVGPKDWFRTEAEALARVKAMLVNYRRKMKREHAREVARIDGIDAALKLGHLPMAKEDR